MKPIRPGDFRLLRPVFRPLLRSLLLLAALAVAAAHAMAGTDARAAAGAAEVAGTEPVLAASEDLDFVRRRGIELYERHRATLVAFEAVREMGLAGTTPEGWITLREDDALRVRFVAPCPEGPCALVDVRIDAEGLSARAIYPPEALTGDALGAWQAKTLVFEALTATCDVPYNAIALPPGEDGERWTVYLVPEPGTSDVVAVSGHVRVALDLDAKEILLVEEFSENCVLVRRTPEQSQLVLDYGWATLPSETHVLNSLLHGLVLVVGTAGGIFRVDGDAVELMRGVDPQT